MRHLNPGDGLVFYSPRERFRGGGPLQRFTAIGVVTGEEPHQVAMRPDFHPWRLAVSYLPSRPAEARPLVDRLSFITDPARWGYPFRRGLFAIPEADFLTIAAAMGADLPDRRPASSPARPPRP